MPDPIHHFASFKALLLLLIITGTMFGAMRPVMAQCEAGDRAKIAALNRKAMASYDAMDFDACQKTLLVAHKAGETAGCKMDWIQAMTLLNLGILSAGGKNKPQIARRFFQQGLRIHPEAPLDKARATPLIQKLYDETRKKLRIVERPKPWPLAEPRKAPPEPSREQGPTTPLEHTPSDSAPRGRPLTITCRAQDSVSAQTIHLSYRSGTTNSYKTLVMKGSQEKWTFTATIPGNEVWGITLQYYIHAKAASEEVLASSGTHMSPHIVSIVATGGAPEIENPLRLRRKKKKASPKKAGRFFLLFGPSFGAGLAKGQVEVMDELGGVSVRTGRPRDRIETPGFAPGSLGVSLEVGYLVLPRLAVTLKGRFGTIKMLTKNVPGAAVADFSVLAQVRYLFPSMVSGWLSPYAGGGLGFAQVRHAVKLDLQEGTFTDTDLSMGVCPAGFGGLLIGKHHIARFYVEAGFLMTFWKDMDLFTFHLDFSMGVSVRF